MERIPWDQYFMAQSHLLAMRSTCERLAVGATIVREKRIIAGGYNGSVTGSVHCSDEGCYVIEGHCVRTVHAEVNAILQCAKFGVACVDAEIYVTHFPCIQCCKAIIQSGIKTVYYAEDYRNHPYAIELFNEANIHVEKVELEYLHIDTKAKEKILFFTKLFKMLEREGVASDKMQALRHEADKLFTSLE